MRLIRLFSDQKMTEGRDYVSKGDKRYETVSHFRKTDNNLGGYGTLGALTGVSGATLAGLGTNKALKKIGKDGLRKAIRYPIVGGVGLIAGGVSSIPVWNYGFKKSDEKRRKVLKDNNVIPIKRIDYSEDYDDKDLEEIVKEEKKRKLKGPIIHYEE